ncbi:alpha-hydroxy-acid oxidizing protein [Thermodesulfobacteriota bacterium]
MNKEKEKKLTTVEIYKKGTENLKKMNVDWVYAGGKRGPSVQANRAYLESLFFDPQFFDPLEVNIRLEFIGVQLKTPVFCSALSRLPNMPENSLTEIAEGIAKAGSFIMLGIGGSEDLQGAIDTGAPVVKIIKPYRNTDQIYKKVRDAESRGCVALGMDIDHFYGLLASGKFLRTELFGPQQTDELQNVISESKLPFIFKGVLSVRDAEKALELGASAIVVSNHGSGAFDYTTPSMRALPKIVERVGNRIQVLVDTGFENGNDVFKALAFGSTAVGFANPMILAYAADGTEGIELLIKQINRELERNMAAAGCADLASIKNVVVTQYPLA